MFNQNDILAALQSGAATAEEIAQKFTDALNAAIAQNEKALADQKKREEKVAAMQSMLTAMADLLENFYPDVYDAALREASAEEVVAAFDAAYEDVKRLSKWFPDADALTASLPREKKNVDTNPIAAFLREHNL